MRRGVLGSSCTPGLLHDVTMSQREGSTGGSCSPQNSTLPSPLLRLANPGRPALEGSRQVAHSPRSLAWEAKGTMRGRVRGRVAEKHSPFSRPLQPPLQLAPLPCIVPRHPRCTSVHAAHNHGRPQVLMAKLKPNSATQPSRSPFSAGK